MKKKLIVMLTVVLVLLLAVQPIYAAKPTAPSRPVDTWLPTTELATSWAADLIAGQTMEVGDVFIDPLGDNEYLVTYKLNITDWYIKEIHFEGISAGEFELISTNGTIVPGRLTVKESFDISEEITVYSFVYSAGAAVTGFAAHAVVGTKDTIVPGETGTDVYVSDDTTMVTDGNVLSASYPYPAVPTNAGTQYGVDTWINQTGTNEWVPAPTWIWESNPVVQPVAGDVVWFERTFEVTGAPTGGDMKILVDNGYAVWLNGKFVGSDNLFQFVGQDGVYPVYGDAELGNLTQLFVDTATWQTVGVFILTPYLQSGSNTLKIMGVNEYFNVGDGSNNTLGTVLNNPGGMAFWFDIDWQIPEVVIPGECETAWGFGSDAGTNNWSQIITEWSYITEYQKVDEVFVPSENGDGVYTSYTLKEDVNYRLDASGTFDYSSATLDTADAEWFEKSPVWVKGEEGSYINIPYVIDVSIYPFPQNTDWGDYNPDHEYSCYYVGKGTPLHLFIWDSNYSDNSGGITVEIFEEVKLH